MSQEQQQQEHLPFRTEIISEVGGDYLGARQGTQSTDQIHYFSQGLVLPSAPNDLQGLLNLPQEEGYLHRLVYSGWDAMAAGGFASLGPEQNRVTLDTSSAVNTINAIVNTLLPDTVDLTKLNQEQAASVRKLQIAGMEVAAPAFLLKNAGHGLLDEIPSDVYATLGLVAAGLATAGIANPAGATVAGEVIGALAMAANTTMVGLAEWHLLTNTGSPDDGLLNTDTTMAFACGSTGAPLTPPDNSLRMWGRTSDGKMVVQDTDQTTLTTHQYIQYGNTRFEVLSGPGHSAIMVPALGGGQNQLAFDGTGRMILSNVNPTTGTTTTTTLGQGYNWSVDQNSGAFVATKTYHNQVVSQIALNQDGSLSVVNDPLGLSPAAGETRTDQAFSDALGHGVQSVFTDSQGNTVRVISEYVDTDLISVQSGGVTTYNRIGHDASGALSLTSPATLDAQGNLTYQQDDGSFIEVPSNDLANRTLSTLPLASDGNYQYGASNGDRFSVSYTYGANRVLENTVITKYIGSVTTEITQGVNGVTTTKVTQADGSMVYTVNDPNGEITTINQAPDGSQTLYSISTQNGVTTSVQEDRSPSGDTSRIVDTGWIDANGNNQSTEDIHSERSGTVMDSHWSSLDHRTVSTTVDASGVVTVTDNLRLPNGTIQGTSTVTYTDGSRSVDVYPGPSGLAGTHVKTTTLVDGTVTVEDYQSFNPNGIKLVTRTTTSPQGGQDVFHYDQGLLVSENASGAPWGDKTITFYPDGSTKTSDITDLAGNRRTTSYNANGHLVSSSYHNADGSWGSYAWQPNGDVQQEDHQASGAYTLSSTIGGVSTSEEHASDQSYTRTTVNLDGTKVVETHDVDGSYTTVTTNVNGGALVDGNQTESVSYDARGNLVGSSYQGAAGHGSFSLVNGVATYDDVSSMGGETVRVVQPNGQQHIEQHGLMGMYTDVVKDIDADGQHSITTSSSTFNPSKTVDEEWANGDHVITTTQMNGSISLDSQKDGLHTTDLINALGWVHEQRTEQDAQHTLSKTVYSDGSYQTMETWQDGSSENYGQDASGLNYHDYVTRADGSTQNLTVSPAGKTLATSANGVHDTQTWDASGTLTSHVQQWDSTGETLTETFGANGFYSKDDRMADGSETKETQSNKGTDQAWATTETWNAGRTHYTSKNDRADGTVTTIVSDTIANTWHEDVHGPGDYSMVDDQLGDGSESRITTMTDPNTGVHRTTTETISADQTIYHSDMVGDDGSTDSLVVNNVTGQSHEEVHNAQAWYTLDRASYNDPYVRTDLTATPAT